MNATQLTVKKSHDLVTARHSFTLMEMRLFTIIVSLIDDRDEDFKTYKIPIKDIIDTFELKSKTIYAEISQLTTSMLKKVITIPLRENNQEKELKTTLVSSFKYNVNGRGILEATFHPAMKPYLLQLKNKFLLYDLKNILKISSGNSIRMYELLKSYEGIGKRVFDIEELKQILGVEDKYSKFANFKTRILLKAQEDLLQHTDISFTFEEISENSRRVEKITFYIHKNSPKQKLKGKTGNNTIEIVNEAN
ncbi:replication initiation protein [Flavobacterium sp.]|jgi:plasmid replication initiation protein|uniref:replication initiation protein n=1 Tax=Flavobacterium sp. TaxID=239 RepID=UPI0037BFF28D